VGAARKCRIEREAGDLGADIPNQLAGLETFV